MLPAGSASLIVLTSGAQRWFGTAIFRIWLSQALLGKAPGKPGASRQAALVGAPVAPVPEPVGRPLDLSLPPDALRPPESREHPGTTLYRGLPGLENAQAQNDPLRTMRRALPALLAPTSEDNPVRIKGRLLMDLAQERSPNAVDGGQLIIEVRTD